MGLFLPEQDPGSLTSGWASQHSFREVLSELLQATWKACLLDKKAALESFRSSLGVTDAPTNLIAARPMGRFATSL